MVKKVRKIKKISQLIKILWKHFSLYIKLKYSPDGIHVQCYTCSKNMRIGTVDCQGGHWIPQGGHSGIRFHEDNVRPQCMRCNMHLSGNSAVFERNLKEEIGEEAVEELFDSRAISGRRNREWYEEKINYYKGKNHELQM